MTPELLSPAGTFSKMKYAIAFGADAVYAGAPRFSLRVRENDFHQQDMAEVVKYAHDRGRKFYLTMNIFAHNSKIAAFLKSLEEVEKWQPDAIIMADPGLIAQTRKHFPNLNLHLSTQANVQNWASVEFWANLGIERVILSRELSISEIAEIHEKVPEIELETFVHGAICIAYSGRCLITNYMNHRDANQGTCTNSCRWEYALGQAPADARDIGVPENAGFFVKEPSRSNEEFPISEDKNGTYLFNARDLCTVELLPQLKEAGVSSFKIEGRTKSEYYAAMTARVYRNAIDKLDSTFDKNLLTELQSLSNRGFTPGFYLRNPKESALNYLDGRSTESSHKVVGMDCAYDAGLLYFTAKNRLDIGDELEVIYPGGVQTVQVREIIDKRGRKCEAAHGGAGRYAIPFGSDTGEFTILRRTLNAHERTLLQR